MRLAAAVVLLAASAFAFDAVLFSSTVKITKDFPSLENFVNSATPEAPVVFLTTKGFSLAQFSKAASAYSTQKSSSSMVNAAKAADSAASRFLDDAVHVPTASYVTPSAPFTKGAAIYVLQASDFTTLDELSKSVIPSLASTAAVFVLTDDDVVSTEPVRVKRVATDEMGGPNPRAADRSFPLVLPPANETNVKPLPCLFYLEGVNVYAKLGSEDNPEFFSYFGIHDTEDGKNNENKWEYQESYAVCPEYPDFNKEKNGMNITTEFTVKIAPSGKVDDKKTTVNTPVSFKLSFTSDRFGYWYLSDVTLLAELKITRDSTSVSAAVNSHSLNPALMGAQSVFSHGWNCWDTPIIWFKGDQVGQLVGLGLHGVQVEVYGKNALKEGSSTEYNNMKYFTSKIESCTGTFSAASWMGIIIILVLVSVFFFGYLMLNSVQTMDRFDDPKQRQIVINVRE